MQIYHYHPDTGEYLGVGVADPDPLDPNNYLHPAFSTPVAPPATAAKQAAVFILGSWSTVADHRGETWYREDRSSVVIEALGDPVALGLLAVQPEPPPPPPPDLKAYAGHVRWQKEVGGTTWNGHPVDTDRASGQPKLLAEFVAISAGLRTDPSPWKFANGAFVAMSNADMTALCLAVRYFIAEQFAIEATVLAAIDAGTVTTTAEIDAAFTVI